MKSLRELIQQEEGWNEETILQIIRSGDLATFQGVVAQDYWTRLVLESIRAVNRFNRQSTILALSILAIALVQVLVMLAAR